MDDAQIGAISNKDEDMEMLMHDFWVRWAHLQPDSIESNKKSNVL